MVIYRIISRYNIII